MWVRYRVDRMTRPAPSAEHAAVDWATRYARNRTRAAVTAAASKVQRVAAWHVDAAAEASYPLAQPDAYGATDEDLTVLVRQGTILTVTRRHAGAEQDWVRHAAFRAAVAATMLWDPRSFRYEARIWPPSTFLEPMVAPMLVADRQRALAGLAPSMRLPEAEATALGAVLKRIVETDAPPWQHVSQFDRDAWHRALSGAVSAPSLQTLFQRGLAEVHTSHDLRGFAVMTGMALAQARP
jgi:hypothetical protein